MGSELPHRVAVPWGDIKKASGTSCTSWFRPGLTKDETRPCHLGNLLLACSRATVRSWLV